MKAAILNVLAVFFFFPQVSLRACLCGISSLAVINLFYSYLQLAPYATKKKLVSSENVVVSLVEIIYDHISTVAVKPNCCRIPQWEWKLPLTFC